MADAIKDLSIGGNLISDLKSLSSVLRTKRTVVFAYGFMFTFVACSVFIAFNPSATSSPWFTNIFGSSGSDSDYPYRSNFSSLLSYFLPNSSRPTYSSTQTTLPSPFPRGDLNVSTSHTYLPEAKEFQPGNNRTEIAKPTSPKSQLVDEKGVPKNEIETSAGKSNSQVPPLKSQSDRSPSQSHKMDSLPKNGIVNGLAKPPLPISLPEKKTESSNGKTEAPVGNQTVGVPSKSSEKEGLPKNGMAKGAAGRQAGMSKSNVTASLLKRNNESPSSSPRISSTKQANSNLLSSMMHCNIFYGRWVEDDSYPLYPPGSCPHIDEPFNCFLNNRPDGAYQKFRWQPKGCNIPRLNGRDMLELLRGKRLVFVGDSLNRNMWESLVCILRNSVQDKSKVFEASGRREFRTEGSYSFLYKDFNCSVEFFRSPFLVQEWEIPDTNGSKKETLRLDVVERSSDKYKNADIIVFNTGHWWTHEKTAKGKDYYQEGSHIYDELNVVEAFRRALTTWARWVDANVNPKKTLVFFRGYSASHFSGGQWNSGGQCDHETEPIKNETYLSTYPVKMTVLESVLKGMRTPVSYLNITRMTDYRKDAHPSIYRKQNLTDEERRSPLRYQDCSHWCLPGVPDSWNELLYAQLLIKYSQQRQQQQKRP
ncbi:protein trichome birefringence-like [Macadamia integrifolia]|uniref:protein trichome birefringence-like n=1 Tax=Macadamia integrifolia TaxID=60698 RepID=UPI001C50191A|nr:protein trichome birefringence-like [Macadamia integrifolia]